MTWVTAGDAVLRLLTLLTLSGTFITGGVTVPRGRDRQTDKQALSFRFYRGCVTGGTRRVVLHLAVLGRHFLTSRS